jgi:hypothetical protein
MLEIEFERGKVEVHFFWEGSFGIDGCGSEEEGGCGRAEEERGGPWL